MAALDLQAHDLTVRGVRLPLGRDHLVFYVLAGIFGSALPFFLITWGQQAVPSGLTAVFFALVDLLIRTGLQGILGIFG